MYGDCPTSRTEFVTTLALARICSSHKVLHLLGQTRPLPSCQKNATVFHGVPMKMMLLYVVLRPKLAEIDWNRSNFGFRRQKSRAAEQLCRRLHGTHVRKPALFVVRLQLLGLPKTGVYPKQWLIMVSLFKWPFQWWTFGVYDSEGN
jgi:hypothetical protein